MEITNRLKGRFCKDTGLPLDLFDEPYFTQRIELYDEIYNSKQKYETFLNTVNKFSHEQEYFEAYNKLKDKVIDYLKNREGMQRFLSEDMNKFQISNKGFRNKDIYKETFVGRNLISIDMKKANYTALRHYDKSIVGNTDSYEEFIRMFTDEEHFVNSKYIRQVVFGNVNPKRQVTYEKYLMDKVLTDILKHTDDIVYFGTDEIVIDITNNEEIETTLLQIVNNHKDQEINLKLENFTLGKIKEGYIKTKSDGTVEIKSVERIDIPIVIRKLRGQDIEESDLVFKHNGRLAKFI